MGNNNFKKFISYAFLTLSTVILTGLVVSNINENPLFFARGDNESKYSITLNSDNKVTSAGDKTQKTASGNDVVFNYYNVASSTTGHVTLNNGGYLVNGQIIRSIESFTCNFSGSGTLKFKVSYDGATWGNETTTISNYKYDLESHPYFIQFTAYSDQVTINSINYQYSCYENPAAKPEIVEEEGETYYQKITSTSEATSGRYLIVYEAGSVAFDGSLTTLDAANNNKTIELSNGKATIPTSLSDDFYFDYDGSGTFTAASGKNLGHDGSGNGLNGKGTNTVDFDENGNVIIRGKAGSGYYLRYNNNSNNGYRFRYYGTSTAQQPIALYKQVVSQGGTHEEYNIPDETLIGFTAVDNKADTYKVGDVYDTANGLVVSALYTGDTAVNLSKGGDNGYSYVLIDANNQEVNTALPFTGNTSATYTLTVSYKNFIPVTIDIHVAFIKVLTSISDVSMTPTTFNTAQNLSSAISTLTVRKNYNDSSSETVTYSNFASKDLQAVLTDPSGQAHDIDTLFGEAGTWHLQVKSTDQASINVMSELIDITVNAIPIVSMSVSSFNNETSVEVDSTLQLTVNIQPENATNKAVEWTSNNTLVATVDDNGLVTGKSAGQATIFATSKDGSQKYASIDITVTAKPTALDVGDFVVVEDKPLAIGSYVIFGSNYGGNNTYAMSQTQSSNNRKGESVIINGTTITRESNSAYAAFRVEEGTEEGTYSFYDAVNEGYLYAASSSNNLLKTQSTKDDNSSFRISGTGSVKDIVAIGTNSRNKLRWNTSSSLFSCYSPSSNTGVKNVSIFDKIGDPIYPTSISLSGSSTVSVGLTIALTVEFTPSSTNVQSVTWSSSDDTIASVDNGVVTGRKAGTVTITATAAGEGGTSIVANKTITVQNIAVSGVSLNKSSTSLTVGATENLVATVNPANATNQEVTWSTSDNSVATVDNGTVTAHSAGTATITVTSIDGGKTATCIVTVTDSGGGGSTGEQSIEYTFSSKSWGASPANWTSGKDGNQLTSGQGVQITTGLSGANATSPISFDNVQSVVVNYCTNASKGAGSIVIEVGNVEVGAQNVTASGGTTLRNMTFSSDGTNSGYITITVNCTTNSIYINSITIVYGTSIPVNPTAIAINPSSIELAAGGSEILGVTYTPSNANQNKAVTWTSSNSSIISVDSSGKVTVSSNATVGTTATITATLTNLTNVKNTCTVTVIETPNADHTVLIYLCGSNLESENYLATGDIEEILDVSGQPDDVNIVIETGGANSWSSKYGISSSKLQRHHVENGMLVTDYANITYDSMGKSSTLQSFIEYGLENYPADRVGLVLWNHGGGMKGVCYDEKRNDDNLLDYEVKNAVSSALSNNGMAGSKLEWIGYDACLMQVQDIAEMNSPYFNYMIASEESEAGYGWDYDTWVDDLYAKKTTPNILKAIVDGFIKDNGGTSSYSNDQTLSYLDLSYAAVYKTAWENMASQLSSKLTSSNESSFNSLIDGCKHYADSDYDYFGTFDAKDFINKLRANSTFNPGTTYTDAVLTAHSNLVAYSSCGKGAGNSYGLAMFWAIDSQCAKGTYYTIYHTNFTNWRTLVSNYGR